MSYVEHAITFGPEKKLIGILCEPVLGRYRAAMPALLLTNVGIQHRVGPFRLYVDLARRLAELGVTTLRFDLSGLGDSSAVSDPRSDAERVVSEMQAAMAEITRRRGIATFVLVGLCSGADHAHKAAVADGRVVGCVFLDGYAYTTPGFFRRRLAAKLTRPRRWRVALQNRLALAKSRGSSAESPPPSLAVRVILPPREQAQREIQGLIDRGCQLLYVYTSDMDYVFNHPAQFLEMYPGLETRGRARAVYLEDANHTFTMLKARERLIGDLGAFVETLHKQGTEPSQGISL